MQNTDSESLVFLLCQDRELSTTFPSIEKNLLTPLSAGLGLFGTKSGQSEGIQYEMDWARPEPEDWAMELMATGVDLEAWVHAANIHPQFLPGIPIPGSPPPPAPGKGSGAIIFFWRYLLGKKLLAELNGLKAEWFAITRSDFLWRLPHPPLENLDPSQVYFLDGERYGGVSDRHVLFHRDLAEPVLTVCHDLFEETRQVVSRYGHLDFINPEVFLFHEWSRLGVMERAVFLPYPCFSVRSEGAPSKGQYGLYNRDLGMYVKYGDEELQSRVFSFFLRNPSSWGRFPAGGPPLGLVIGRAVWRSVLTYSRQKKWIRYRSRFARIWLRKLVRRMVRRLKGTGEEN